MASAALQQSQEALAAESPRPALALACRQLGGMPAGLHLCGTTHRRERGAGGWGTS